VSERCQIASFVYRIVTKTEKVRKRSKNKTQCSSEDMVRVIVRVAIPEGGRVCGGKDL